MTLRTDKVGKLVAENAASFLNSVTDSTSLITVTSATISPDFSSAKVFVTVLPEEEEESALKELALHAVELQSHLAKNTKLRRTPKITFVLDHGEKNRQRIDRLNV